MTALNLKPSLALVLAHEGGYVNHPRDPGGATNQGVTQAVYDAYRRLKGLPTRSVKFIEAAEVEAIYRQNYWRLVRGDDLPAGLDYALFDFAVNSGVSRAIKFIQRGVGFTGDGVDGIIGDITMSRILDAAKVDEERLIIGLCNERMKFLRGLATFDVFGKGWTRRVEGDQAGVQANVDKGVVDYAVAFARRDPIFVMPSAIGSKPGEVAGAGKPPVNDNTGPISYADAQANGWGRAA